MTDWHAKEIRDLINEFNTSEGGLSPEEAKKKLVAVGANALPEAKPEHPLFLFFRQFRSPLIYVLLGAGTALSALGNFSDAAVIFAGLVLNAIVGAMQEAKAEHTLRSKARKSPPMRGSCPPPTCASTKRALPANPSR